MNVSGMRLALGAAVFSSSWFARFLAARYPEPAHAPDFRAVEKIAPLVFPPKPNAPFMTVAKTTWVRTLLDGSTETHENQRDVARQCWYSRGLGVNVTVERHDPRDGDQTLWPAKISGTADPSTFEIPAGYRILDNRMARRMYAGSAPQP